MEGTEQRVDSDAFHFSPQKLSRVPRAWDRVAKTSTAANRKGRTIYKRINKNRDTSNLPKDDNDEPERILKRQCVDVLPALPAHMNKQRHYAATLSEQAPAITKRKCATRRSTRIASRKSLSPKKAQSPLKASPVKRPDRRRLFPMSSPLKRRRNNRTSLPASSFSVVMPESRQSLPLFPGLVGLQSKVDEKEEEERRPESSEDLGAVSTCRVIDEDVTQNNEDLESSDGDSENLNDSEGETDRDVSLYLTNNIRHEEQEIAPTGSMLLQDNTCERSEQLSGFNNDDSTPPYTEEQDKNETSFTEQDASITDNEIDRLEDDAPARDVHIDLPLPESLEEEPDIIEKEALQDSSNHGLDDQPPTIEAPDWDSLDASILDSPSPRKKGSQFRNLLAQGAETSPTKSTAKRNSSGRMSDDTTMLLDFVKKAQSKKAAEGEAFLTTEVDEITEPVFNFTISPRKPLSSLTTNSSSPPSPTHPSTPPHKDTTASQDANDDADELSASVTTSRRSARRVYPRTRKMVQGTPSIQLHRRLGGTNPAVLQGRAAVELAMLTRTNTRRNKGQARMPKMMLEILESKELSPIKDRATKLDEKRKMVDWDERLVYFQEEVEKGKEEKGMKKKIETKDEGEEDKEKEKPAKETKSIKVKRIQGLGVINGTPVAKKVGTKKARVVEGENVDEMKSDKVSEAPKVPSTRLPTPRKVTRASSRRNAVPT